MSEQTVQPPVAGDIPVQYFEGIPCLDLRQVTTPPKPLIAIIELIEREQTGDIVHVLMSRDPINLYPELVERGWTWTKQLTEDGSLRLILSH